ncbi:response regulator, partial [Cupriavidus respiraculi]
MIRVLIADDHQIVRAGLRQFISDEPDIRVEGEAASGDEVMTRLRESEFDVVVLDISMPDRNGIDVLKLIRQRYPDLPVLILSTYPEDQYAINLIRQRYPDLPVLILSTYPEDQYAINLIRAGASGYLTK